MPRVVDHFLTLLSSCSRNGFSTKDATSVFADLHYPVAGDSVHTYLKSMYWTILAMTTIGDLQVETKVTEDKRHRRRPVTQVLIDEEPFKPSERFWTSQRNSQAT